jgi:ferredoxin/truncated hemoglobin YjbI
MHDDLSTVTVHYNGQAVSCRNNETLLEAFLRAGIDVDFSCKSGVCHRCMVKRIEGEIPFAASKKLPKHQQDAGCLLLCQCRPTTSIVLAPKSVEDIVTRCTGSKLFQGENGQWCIRFEPHRTIKYQTKQLAELLDKDMASPCLGTIISLPDSGSEIVVEFDEDVSFPEWLANSVGATEEFDFYLRGPLPVEPKEPLVPLPPDPELWDALGGDVKIRAVLETFYEMVYADPDLSPFFERVTIDRIIGKQFAFLKENIQGVSCFLGEQPRNTHNWMVISDALFDHRHLLMLKALRSHGLSDELIAQLNRYEEQFRTEIVKYKPWPKRYGNIAVDTEQYETCLLEEATVCDYCGSEIPTNTVVRYHKRLGKLGCESCASTTHRMKV